MPVSSPPLRSAGPARLDLLLSDDDEPAGGPEPAKAPPFSLFAAALRHAEPLEGAGRAAVAQAIQEDALTVVRVPVVSLPQRRRRMVTVHLECHHGSAAREARSLLDGEAGELVAALDLEHVRAAVRAADRPVAGTENLPVIVRVAAASFDGEEARTALATLLNRRAAQSAALHLVLDAWPGGRAGAELVAILRRAGVGVGLELNERPCLSPDAVAARRIGMVCLQAGELHQAALRAADGDVMEDIRTMQRQGVEVVVTGIGSERTLAEVLDFPIRLGTGDLFGRIG
jgi:EAL domain-containing protein (putative c-di-GMP-specific phosphodiesterase class I)